MRTLTSLTIAFCFLSASFARAQQNIPQFINTQAQFDPAGVRPNLFSSVAVLIVKEMDRAGVSVTFIVPPPFPPGHRFRYDFEEILPAIKNDSGRFAFLGGGGSANPQIIATKPEAVSDADRDKLR